MLKDIKLTDKQAHDVSGVTYNTDLCFEFTDGFRAGMRLVTQMHVSHMGDTKPQVADSLRQLANEIENNAGGRFYTNINKV